MAIPFKFHNNMALRIANLITKDIERLESAVFGTRTNWQAKFNRPYKAHFANYLAVKADTDKSRFIPNIELMLPAMESAAKAYSEKKDKRGRPLTVFEHSDSAGAAAVQEMDSEEQIEAFKAATEAMHAKAEDAWDEIDYANIPAEMDIQKTEAGLAKSRAAMAKINAKTNSADVDATLAALRDVLLAKGKTEIDADSVRQIVKDEVAKLSGIKPTLVHVMLPDAKEAKDMGVQHCQFPRLLRAVQLFPVWLPGPAGSGKSTAAENVAKALNLPFHPQGAVDNVYQLLGFIDAGGQYHRTEFREAYEHGGVFLWDEVDASNPAALVAFNGAIENGRCAFPDGVVTKHKDCRFIAAANTYGTGATHEYVGRTKLDAATVDRFVMLDWDYDETLERAIAGDNEWTNYVQKVRRAVKAAGLKHLVTPRASIRGNALLAAGETRENVINMCVRKGLSEDQWNNIKGKL